MFRTEFSIVYVWLFPWRGHAMLSSSVLDLIKGPQVAEDNNVTLQQRPFGNNHRPPTDLCVLHE